MQNQLRVKYRSGYWPIVGITLIFLIYTSCLFLINLEMLHRVLLLGVGILLTVYEYWQITKTDIHVIRHDGEKWLTEYKDKTCILELHPHSFISRFLLVLTFNLPSGKKKIRLYFTTQNCTQSDFRHLCRLLVH